MYGDASIMLKNFPFSWIYLRIKLDLMSLKALLGSFVSLGPFAQIDSVD